MKNIINSKLVWELLMGGGISFIMFYLLIGNTLVGDDISNAFPQKISSIIEFNVPWGAAFIMNFMYILMYKIPRLLSINIQDWQCIFGAFFKSFVITLFFLYLYKFISKKEINYTHYFLIAAIFMLYMNFILLISPFSFYVVTAFFRFLIPNLLFLIFIYYLFNFMNNEKVNIALFYVIAFLSASSQECIGAMELLIISLCIFFSYIKEKDKTKLRILSLIAVIITAGFLLLVLSSEFSVHVGQKTNGILSAINDIKNNWNYCVNSYTQNFLKRYIIAFCLLPILWLLNMKKEKNSIDYTNYISLFVFFSCVALAVFLVFLGKTHYAGGFWIEHEDIHTILYTGFLVSIIMPLGKIINRNKYINVLVLIISIIVITFSSNDFINGAVHLKKAILNIKDFTYLHDKMALFYLHKHQAPVMPYSYFEDNLPYIVALYSPEDDFPCERITKSDDKLFQPIEYYDFYDTNFRSYPPIEYRKNALKYYTDMGGVYDEIKAHKYHFSDLKNKDFVLNNL